MAKKLDIAQLVKTATLPDQYQKQLDRIKKDGNTTDMIDEAVRGVLDNLPKAKGNSLVIYGDPSEREDRIDDLFDGTVVGRWPSFYRSPRDRQR
ncbi:hypothetical protein [Candidatus Nitrospira nitrificans]|uniref:Uncharacterized protein n=1 Tax=Candidatus Nitrospira nitrificans TaxID=1742973 RepID=A0A0S4LC08_9BACT|nr:hypothetical protein [Candidatus Nitrospira nitrificans]CUS35292.1 hypothetical protein COMA2_20191 [Candidatus Nitrospira nitrificans]